MIDDLKNVDISPNVCQYLKWDAAIDYIFSIV